MTVFVAQKVSFFRAQNNNLSIKKFVNSCLYISVVLGAIFTLILILFSKQFSIFQGDENAKFGYIIISSSIIFSAISSVIKGYFQGYENMFPTSISNILEQLVKMMVGLVLSLILSKFGIIYAVLGAFIGVFVSEFVIFVYLLIKFLLAEKKYNFFAINRVEIKHNFTQFLPISLSNNLYYY